MKTTYDKKKIDDAYIKFQMFLEERLRMASCKETVAAYSIVIGHFESIFKIVKPKK